MLRVFVVAAVVTLAIAGCSDSSAPGSGTVTVQSQPQFFVVGNNTSKTVYFFVVGQEIASSLDWVACDNSAQCGPGLASGASKTVLHSEVCCGGLEGETKAIVYWWQLSDPEGQDPVINNIVVPVRR